MEITQRHISLYYYQTEKVAIVERNVDCTRSGQPLGQAPRLDIVDIGGSNRTFPVVFPMNVKE